MLSGRTGCLARSGSFFNIMLLLCLQRGSMKLSLGLCGMDSEFAASTEIKTLIELFAHNLGPYICFAD